MSNTDIVKKFSDAFCRGDIGAIKQVVAENYSFKGPMMQLEGREALIAFIENMPMVMSEKNSTYIEQGDTVVKQCRFEFSVPPIGLQEMCEVFTLKDGKITKAQLYYDTAAFPKPEQQAA